MFFKLFCILCIVLGLSEGLGVMANLGPFTARFLPWSEAIVSTGGAAYIAYIGVPFAAMYIFLGVIGLIKGGKADFANKLVFLSVAALGLHLTFLVIAFFAGGFSYLSILMLFVPILYLVGAAQSSPARKIKNTVTAYSFIAPNLVGFSIFTLIPMGIALVMGFMHWNIADNSFTFVGLDNFMRMRTDHLFWPSLRNTIFFTAGTVPLTMLLSLSLALLLNNKIRGRSIFRSVMFFPHVASLIAMAAVWNQIFHPSWGPVNQFLGMLGVEGPRWTIHPWIIPNIIFFTAWRNMGYFMVIYLAGLQSIPEELYEAASIDGAGAWKKFLKITLPQLRFVTFFVSVLLMITSFRVFDQVIMITNTETPGTAATMLVVHIFRTAFISWDMGYASAIALVLLALVMSITIVQFLIQRHRQREY